MGQAREAIHEALEAVRVIDVHCHLRPQKPAADSLADVLLYHHVWVELISSGMPQRELGSSGLPQEIADLELPPVERVRRALKYLPNIRNTTLGLMLRWLLADLYGVEEVSEANLEWLYVYVRERGGDPRWQEEVLRQRCGIEASISVEHTGDPYSPALALGREGLPINLQDGKRSPSEVLASLDAILGREVRTAGDYQEMLAKLIGGWSTRELRFVGLWPLPNMTPDLANECEATRLLEKARRGEQLSPRELGSFTYYAVTASLDRLREGGPRTIQLIVGAEVLPPHRSLTHWSERFTGALGRLANAYEDFHFNLSSASDLYTQDLGILAKHIPNVSVAGYWWHTFYPYYIRKSLETRLDMVPMNKIVGFFSDAYHAEWCYPKLKLVKQITEDVLVDRVERGWYSLELALELVERLFHRNAKEIYGL